MRQIKFRAWVPELKQISVFDEGELYSPKGWEIMQFTGLLDKNGKEIYEGDVVEWGQPYGDGMERRMVHEVQWIENGFWLRMENGENYLPNEIYVIGNIYENPELLK